MIISEELTIKNIQSLLNFHDSRFVTLTTVTHFDASEYDEDICIIKNCWSEVSVMLYSNNIPIKRFINVCKCITFKNNHLLDIEQIAHTHKNVFELLFKYERDDYNLNDIAEYVVKIIKLARN